MYKERDVEILTRSVVETNASITTFLQHARFSFCSFMAWIYAYFMYGTILSYNIVLL